MRYLTNREKEMLIKLIPAYMNAKTEESRGVQHAYYDGREYVQFDNGRIMSLPVSFVKTEFWFGRGQDRYTQLHAEAKKQHFIETNMRESFRDFGYFQWKAEKEAAASGQPVFGTHLMTPLLVTPKGSKDPTKTSMLFEVLEGDLVFWNEHFIVEQVNSDELFELDSIMRHTRDEYEKELIRTWELRRDCVCAKELLD